jgi:ribosomal protein S18 acetylase RimI-like enzyme
MPDRQVTVQPLATSDLPAVAAIHTAAFADSALTRLGEEVVRRYYEWQLLGPHEVTALGIYVDAELSGFCFAGIFRGAMAGFLERNRTFLMWRLFSRPWLLANSLVRDRMRSALRSLRRVHRRRRTSAPTAPRPTHYGVLAIAVHPKRQGLGLGARLMREVETAARRHGYHHLQLTVDPHNTESVRFYRHLAWEPVLSDGAWHGQMWKHLEQER